MAITFPRALPDELLLVGLSFPPAPMIEVTPLRSGRQISANLGPTLWRPRYDSAAVNMTRAGVVRALYDTLLSAEEFYAYDHSREYPLAYTSGWPGGFDGTGTLADVAANNVEIDLGNLFAGMVLSPGDYLAFNYSTSLRALHRVVAAATADGSGEVTVEVRPHVRPGWEADAEVQFYRAACRAIILPGTYSEQVEPGNFVRFSFEAVQSL